MCNYRMTKWPSQSQLTTFVEQKHVNYKHLYPQL